MYDMTRMLSILTLDPMLFYFLQMQLVKNTPTNMVALMLSSIHVGRDSKMSWQQVLDVCWIKCYAVDTVVKGGFKEKRMHCVGPTGDDD